MKTPYDSEAPKPFPPARARHFRDSHAGLAFVVGLLALVYFGAAKLGLALAFEAEQVTAVWPPTGIALAAVLFYGFRVWPGIFVGALLANATANEPLATAGGIAAGNTLEAVVGAWLLLRFVQFRNSLERLRDVLGFVVLAAVVSTTISATIGVISLCLGGVQPWAAFGALWCLWWLGDAAGAVLVTPLLLTWVERRPLFTKLRRAEAVVLIGSVVVVGLVVFAAGVTPSISSHPLEYTVFPFVIWAALRFGQPGTTSVTFVASCIAVWGTVHGFGPFATGSAHENLILLQAFMAVLAVTALLLSAAIAERGQAAAALRNREEESRRQFQELDSIYDTAPVGLSLVDTSLRYVRINHTLAEINGVPVEKTLGRTLREVIPQLAPAIEPVYRRIIETGKPVLGFEVHGSTPREPEVERDWLVSYYPLAGADGSVVAVNCIVQDITARKHAERALRVADRRKDEFLATLAHELRNPLAPIRNALHLLTLSENNAEVRAQAMGVMGRQLAQMVRLIDDLLDVSRITRNKLELRKGHIELSSIIQSAVEVALPVMQESAHEFTVTLPHEPVRLDADPVRLAQIFSNLLHNAAKFTPRGGRIRLVAEQRGADVLVSVRDTGIGIDREHLPRLFEMFSQVTPALNRSHGGLGIGLALARGLAVLHGGDIAVHSDGPGQGSEFVVRLPLGVPSTIAAQPPEPVRKPPGIVPTCRVLVVDDNRDAAESLGTMLQLLGHETRTAHDGLEAVEAATAYRPDVVLLDIGLPKMNGYEAAREIRRQAWGKDLLLIALTGWGQDEDKLRAMEAGFDHHLTKPMEPDAILELLRTRSQFVKV